MSNGSLLAGILVLSFSMVVLTDGLLWRWIYSELGRNHMPQGEAYSGVGLCGYFAVAMIWLELGPSIESAWCYAAFGVSTWLGGVAGLFLYELVSRVVRLLKGKERLGRKIRLEVSERCESRIPVRPLEPEMVTIPAGSFLMGTERLRLELAEVKRGKRWFEHETPQHRLHLPSYKVGKYPVTNAEYARFIKDGGYQDPAFWTTAGWEWREYDRRTQPRYWREEKWNGSRQPVVGVSWYEAVAYCNWLAYRTRKAYNLPSEAEWEKAARGTEGFVWPWGNSWGKGRSNTNEEGPLRTTPVGYYSHYGNSPYRCSDMIGNVWEWTRSIFADYCYDPEDGREDLSASTPRVVRGGSWDNSHWYARCASRYRSDPKSQWNHLGFRVWSPLRK